MDNVGHINGARCGSVSAVDHSGRCIFHGQREQKDRDQRQTGGDDPQESHVVVCLLLLLLLLWLHNIARSMIDNNEYVIVC